MEPCLRIRKLKRIGLGSRVDQHLCPTNWAQGVFYLHILRNGKVDVYQLYRQSLEEDIYRPLFN
jgi:hypothetical protein